MKRLFPFLPLLAALASVSAQDNSVRVTVTMLDAGRRKNTITNPETRSKIETIEDNNGKILSKSVIALDERNLEVSASYFDGKGTLLSRATFKHDSADRIEEMVFTSPTGQPLGRRVFTFGVNNKVAQMDTYNAAGQLITPQKPQGPGRPDKKKRR